MLPILEALVSEAQSYDEPPEGVAARKTPPPDRKHQTIGVMVECATYRSNVASAPRHISLRPRN